MDGTDLLQFNIFPVRPEASWVTGAPKFRKLGDDGQPLKARFDANYSGCMTNTMMKKYFWPVIKPGSKGMDNETRKRHVWLLDSAGAHVYLLFLKLMRDHDGIFVPRTPYLSFPIGSRTRTSFTSASSIGWSRASSRLSRPC